MILNLKNQAKTIAIIPARGDSKRLKGKNLLNLGPYTLLEHSIKYALSNMDIIDKIVVSTDDNKIKKQAKLYDVEVIDRPKELASDTATTVEVILHVLENVPKSYDNVILLQPTNPLRPVDLLRSSFQLFEAENHESLFTVTRNESKLGRIVNGSFFPYNYQPGQRSQDMEPLFFENGLIYIVKADVIKRDNLITERSFPFIIEHPFSQVDIDVQDDLDFAEFIYNKYNK